GRSGGQGASRSRHRSQPPVAVFQTRVFEGGGPCLLHEGQYHRWLSYRSPAAPPSAAEFSSSERNQSWTASRRYMTRCFRRVRGGPNPWRFHSDSWFSRMPTSVATSVGVR